MCSGRPAAPTDKASGFLLSMLSPVWRTKLCGSIGGEARWQLALDDGEAALFRKLVTLGSGAVVTMDEGLEGLIALGLMADRYQVEAVQEVVEEAVLRLLTVESCSRVLAASNWSGLERVEKASRAIALRDFDEFARTAGFMDVGEDVLESLLEHEGLRTETEERVYEGVVRWMKGGEGGAWRGLGLLGKVRFPFMERDYLAALSQEAGRDLEDLAGLAGLVEEALWLKGIACDEWGKQVLRHLDRRAVLGRGVRWEEYVEGGERRVAANQVVWSVVAFGEYVCGGLVDGSIQVWSRSTLDLERTLTGHTDTVMSLLPLKVRLVSGANDNDIRVWDVASGRCEGVLEGHTNSVTSLAWSGGRLLSGSRDGTVRVWGVEGEVSGWWCERILEGAASAVLCLAAWADMVAYGCEDGAIRVLSCTTWALERTLQGHAADVSGLVWRGRRLISSAMDAMVLVWSTDTWEHVQTMQAYPAESGQYVSRLAVCGSSLVGGSYHFSESGHPELRVWDLDTLRPLHTLTQEVGNDVLSLVCDGGEVWGAVGNYVAVWGRRV